MLVGLSLLRLAEFVANPFLVRRVPKTLEDLAIYCGCSELPRLTSLFIYEQTHPNEPSDTASTSQYPIVNSRIRIFPSAIATFHAPSDPCNVAGMHHERIRCTNLWRKQYPRHDCVFVSTDASQPGMRGLHVARVRLLFSFKFEDISYPCALVEWFEKVSNDPDEETGMWVVEPELGPDGTRVRGVIHVDTILRAAHLIPVYQTIQIPANFHFSDSLDAFKTYYVNKFADHHAHEIAF